MTDIARAADTREVPLEAGGIVEISLSSADVRLRGTDGDRVVVRTRDGRPVDDALWIEATPGRVRIRDGESGVHIGPLHLFLGSSPDLDIDVPRTASLLVRTLSGDVAADGIGGPSRWTSASGSLRVAVSRGPVAMESMSGDAVLDATGALAVTARTVSGDVQVRAHKLEALTASTTSGDVRIEAAFGEGVVHAVSSVSGDVEIATGSPVRVETQTIAGDVRASGTHVSEGGLGRRTLVVGDGSIRLSVRTTSGDVRLRTVGPGVPGMPEVAAASTPAEAPRPPAPSEESQAPGVPQPPTLPEASTLPEAPQPPAGPEPPASPEPPVAPGSPAAEPPPVPGPVAPVEAAPLRVVAEAEAAPNLVRAVAAAEPAPPAGDADAPVPVTSPAPGEAVAWSGAPSTVERREAARLDVLRALERGELDVDAASRRLEILEDAGPRAFRGWC